MGVKAFVEQAKALQRKHGADFKPPKLLLEMAEKGETFYRHTARTDRGGARVHGLACGDQDNGKELRRRPAFSMIAELLCCKQETGMTKLERAIEEAKRLPVEEQEKLGDNVLSYVQRYLALREDLNKGLQDIEAGRVVEGKALLRDLKAKYGA
jgi:predicted transcriptional regulator